MTPILIIPGVKTAEHTLTIVVTDILSTVLCPTPPFIVGYYFMRFDIITIFPHILDGFLNESLLARAQAKKIIKIGVHNLRKWTNDRHQTVDDKPYGGGVGMVL